MVEEIALPIDLRDSARDPFKIADEIGKLGIAWDANQHVGMIRHQQKQFHMASLQSMISARRFEQDVRNTIGTKLIYTAVLAADCYEIGRAESPVEMSRMVERLADRARRGGVHVGGRLRSIAPT